MAVKYLGYLIAVIFLVPGLKVQAAEESDMIKSDRRALAAAMASGSSSKIMAAKEQLSDDLAIEKDRRRRDAQGTTIPLVADGQGHFLAEVLINNSVHASLVVDTGAPVIMLTSAFLQKLNLDTGPSKRGYVELLNGKYKSAAVSLNSVELGQAQAHDVSAVVLLEDGKVIGDGLLGLSFLSRFHFTIDQAGKKLVLRKPE